MKSWLAFVFVVACAIPDLREPVAPVVSRVDSTPNEVRYAVVGSTGEQAFEAMKEAARTVIPATGAGTSYLQWRLEADHATRTSHEGCHLTQVVVEVGTTTFLPTWTDVGTASARDQVWWSETSTRQEAYRAEQRGIVHEGAERLRAAVVALPVQSCVALGDQVRLLQKQEGARIKAELAEAAEGSDRGELLPPGPLRTVR